MHTLLINDLDSESSLKKFAQCCYDQNSLAELRSALEDGPDHTDLRVWGLTAVQWRFAIAAAINELLTEAD